MKRKIWLFIFLTVSLLLLLGGTHLPTAPVLAEDPVVQSAEIVAAHFSGAAEDWKNAARENPVWILQIDAANEND